MSSSIIILIAFGALVLLYIMIYNGLVAKRVATENAWSQIDVQLKRRHDLIPNLVETVKGYASHEKATLEQVMKARSSAVSAAGTGNVAGQAQAENMLSGALRQLLAVSENYPQLKANENFLSLQEEISSTENRIGFARQHYNDSVGVYNASILQIPANIVASIGHFTSKVFFELDQTEAAAVKQAPKVSFS